MRNLSIIALVTAVSLCFAGNVTQTLTYSSSALKLGTENGYTTVDFAGYPHIDKLGAPDLPVVPLQVVIPPTAEVTGFEITELREEPVSGNYHVIPVQYPEPYMDNAPQFPFVGPNPVYYGDGQFPAQAAELTAAGSKAGYRLASFRVYPVRCNPVTGGLSVVTRLTIRVSYETGKAHTARRSEMQIAMHGRDVKRLVLNPQDADRFAPARKTSEYGSAFLPAGSYEHIILTTRGYVDSLIPLRDWRTRQGWRSKIVEIDSVCATYPGVDTADKMRNFLKDAETTWSTIFCFIARKDWPANQFRRAYAYVSGYPVEYLPCDMYYSCLDGSWNADGDGIWGEPADSCDYWADIHVGMITLDGVGEMGRYLAKVFRYEFTPDTGWFCKALLGNDVTFSNEFNDSVAIATPSPPWFDLKMYSSGGMVTPSVQGYCDSLNSGYPVTVVIAHGSNDLYGMGGNVTSPIMNALTNVNRLSMITAVCCHTGEYDVAGNTNGDCIAENMAFHAPNGFIGVMKNTRYGWVRVAEFYNYSICYGLLGYRTPRRITQGEALSYGKDYWHALVAVVTDTSKFRYEAYERTLFGEPAVPIWTGRAFRAVVQKPAAINIGSGIPVNITVTDAFSPVESAMVCLVKGTETFARGFTDGSGQITLMVSPLTPGMMQLTVSGANNYPYLDSIVVMAAGKFVSYLRHTISDPSPGGNGDGIINPGESFRLPTWVKNYGTQTANSVNGRLRTHAAGVTVTDSLKTFGNIAGGDSAENTQGFGMTVATGLPNGYAIPCSLVCKDNLDSTWVSYVTLRVGAPVLNFVGKDIRDSLGSNPNGKLDPDETADLIVTIANAGIGNAYNVHATLRSGDARLTILDSLANYGTVPHDSTVTNHGDHFALHADVSIPRETPVPCTLDIYGDAGYVSHAAFMIIVGEVRTIDPIPDGPRTPALYWAYDEVDSGYTEHPDFSWIEVRGRGTQLTLGDDETRVVGLPVAFGPFRYYGTDYSQVSICSNGWVAPGSTTLSTYSNTTLPAGSMPPCLFINWDDIYPPSGGGVWYYHDTANHCFVVEWDSVRYFSGGNYDKYEIIIYDTTRASADGNCEIVFQYLTATGIGSQTVGIQDPTLAIFIQTLFDGTYTRGASTWVAGHAIKYTTDPPQVGIVEPGTGMTIVARRPLDVFPNPFRTSALVRWNVKTAGSVDLKVFDASGRVVKTLASGSFRAGSYSAAWNGTDESGRKLAHGIYFVRLATPGQTNKVKTVLTR